MSMKFFKVTNGMYEDRDGKRYTKGDTVASLKNLDKVFPNKFIAVSQPPVGKLVVGNTPQIPFIPKQSVAGKKVVGKSLGKDVTEKFGVDNSTGITVYQKDGSFVAVKDDEAISDKLGKIEMKTFLSEYDDEDSIDEE